jgi:glycosyltransferase involved in cell wall biosynthesis
MNFYTNVSVIVAVFNAKQTIEECIQSLISLNYPKEKLELIFFIRVKGR